MPEFHKYTISKKGFWRKSFEIHHNNKLLYSISCPGWFSYSRIIFKDSDDKVVLQVEKTPKLFQFKFEFTTEDGSKAELTKASLSNEYTLTSNWATYRAQGNWRGNEFTIYLGEDDIAKVSRKTWSNKNQYGIAIIEGNHNLFILGMVISIELVKMINEGNG